MIESQQRPIEKKAASDGLNPPSANPELLVEIFVRIIGSRPLALSPHRQVTCSSIGIVQINHSVEIEIQIDPVEDPPFVRLSPTIGILLPVLLEL